MSFWKSLKVSKSFRKLSKSICEVSERISKVLEVFKGKRSHSSFSSIDPWLMIVRPRYCRPPPLLHLQGRGPYCRDATIEPLHHRLASCRPPPTTHRDISVYRPQDKTYNTKDICWEPCHVRQRISVPFTFASFDRNSWVLTCFLGDSVWILTKEKKVWYHFIRDSF